MKKEIVKDKKKKHIILKIILGILLVILIIVSIYFGKRFITKIKDNKIKDSISELREEKTDYMFVEINPSFALTIKNNKVNSIACLNDDCVSIYSELKIIDKSIDDSIEYLYNFVKDKGFNTSNGVNIKTSDNIKIDTKKLDYVKVERIDEKTKKELISNIINNEEIKDISNEDYYTKLWNKLKKDSDYDKYYTCNMNNEVLECYLIEKAFQIKPKDRNNPTISETNKYYELEQKVIDILNKFDIKTKYNLKQSLSGENSYVYIEDKAFEYELLHTSETCNNGDRKNCTYKDEYLVVIYYIPDENNSGTTISFEIPDNISEEEKEKYIEDYIKETSKQYTCKTELRLNLKDINLLNPNLSKAYHNC